MIPGILREVAFSAAGADTWTPTDGFLVREPSFSDETETVATARGTDRRLGYTQAFDVEFFDYDVFAQLNTMQLAAAEIDLRFTFEGASNNVFTYSNIRHVVVPLFGQFSDKVKIYIADAGTATDPPDVAWTDLGSILEGSAPELEAHFINDGNARPIYTITSLNWEMEFIDDVAAALQSYNEDQAEIAIQHPDGTYLRIDELNVYTRPQPNIGLDAVVTRVGVFSTAKRNILDVLTLPATPPNYFYGCRLTGRATGVTEADILTIT